MKKRNLNSLLTPAKPSKPLAAKKDGLPKILTLDIETSPNVAYTWGLYDQNISVSQILEGSRVLCVTAKWYDSKSTIFLSENDLGHAEMIRQVWELLNEADIMVTYNGISFDAKHLNREFILAGLTPPAPYLNIDLYRTVRSQFKFASNKLDYVSQALGIGQKIKHEGQALWNAVLAGDAKAWAKMRKYNIQDVLLTESLFDFLGPWIKSMPNMGIFTGERCCYRCASKNLADRGLGHTNTIVYNRLLCEDCGAWNRSSVSRGKLQVRPLA
jgi:DNA polymerase elongation subunit (family B)